MALKDWKKLKHWLYDENPQIKAMWMYLSTGDLLILKRKGNNYYIDYTGKKSIIILTSHHPSDPIKSYSKALLIAKKFMKKH